MYQDHLSRVAMGMGQSDTDVSIPSGPVGRWLTRPVGVAVAYFLFGVTWIVATDALLLMSVEDGQRLSFLQTVKGWVFVGGSTLLIFGLVWYGTTTLQRTNRRLDRALTQMSILHRLVRHNLRNNCTVIYGHVELLEESTDGDVAEQVEAIKTETERLIELTEKTHYLRDLMLDPPEGDAEHPVGSTLESAIDRVERRHPEARLTVDVAGDPQVPTHPRLKRALVELIDNAIVHADDPEPVVRVSLGTSSDGSIEITIEDEGPGMPEMERSVLERGMETPQFHSLGLGLWIARSIVIALDGALHIADNEPRGTVVTVSLPPAE